MQRKGERHLESYPENLIIIVGNIPPGIVFPRDTKLSVGFICPADPFILVAVDLFNQPGAKTQFLRIPRTIETGVNTGPWQKHSTH